MKENLLVAIPIVDSIKDGRQLLFRLLEQCLQLFHFGALLQKHPRGLPVGVVIPQETAGKAGTVRFIHTVEQSVVGTGGKGQQLRRHSPVGVVGGMEMFQQKPGRGVGVDDRAALHRSAGHDRLHVRSEGSGELSHIMEQAGQIACFGQMNRMQPFRGKLGCIPVMFRQGLNFHGRAIWSAAEMCWIKQKIPSSI